MKDEDHNDRVVQAQMGSKWLLGRWLISKFDSETTNYRRHIFILRLVLSVKIASIFVLAWSVEDYDPL